MSPILPCSLNGLGPGAVRDSNIHSSKRSSLADRLSRHVWKSICRPDISTRRARNSRTSPAGYRSGKPCWCCRESYQGREGPGPNSCRDPRKRTNRWAQSGHRYLRRTSPRQVPSGGDCSDRRVLFQNLKFLSLIFLPPSLWLRSRPRMARARGEGHPHHPGNQAPYRLEKTPSRQTAIPDLPR